MYPRFKQPAADVSATPRFPKGTSTVPETCKSTDPVEVRQRYDALAAEISTAEAEYQTLGEKLKEMKQRREALAKHLGKLTNPNARV